MKLKKYIKPLKPHQKELFAGLVIAQFVPGTGEFRVEIFLVGISTFLLAYVASYYIISKK